MDGTSRSEDNSSLLNPSTNAAEAGTTEPRDEEHETSSIEALNWSEVDEEELAAAQKAEAAAAALGKENMSPLEDVKEASPKKTEEEKSSSTNGSGGTVLITEDGNALSTSLLQSINSTISDEDPEARKLSVIENWAEEVTNARERGEIEMGEDFPEDSGVTGDDEEEEVSGVRKRKGKKLTPEMVSSIITDSSVDPLSNAPVLDDGPIWNKGPRSYTFQENRRINQKLTFCLLIAVVLAIGLGLGNLVAHQECEAEFKATQKHEPRSHQERSPIPATIPTTTPSPIIPARSTDSSMSSQLPPKRLPSIEPIEEETPEVKKEFKRRDEPIIDPKYAIHAETVSKVVHTLDHLSRKIDQFENTTRQLQGVLMIPEEEEKETTESPTLYDKQVYRDDEPLVDVDDVIDEPFQSEEEEAKAFWEMNAQMNQYHLIEEIEQTPDYVARKQQEKEEKEFGIKDRKLWDVEEEVPESNEPRERDDILKMFDHIKEFQRRFVKSERKRIMNEFGYDKNSYRFPEDYSEQEREALTTRQSSAFDEFADLIKKHKPESDEDYSKIIDLIFGVEEDIPERTYEEAFPMASWLKNLEDSKDIPEATVEEENEAGQSTDEIIILEPTTESPPLAINEDPLPSSAQSDAIESINNGKSREHNKITKPEVTVKKEEPSVPATDKQENGSNQEPPSAAKLKREAFIKAKYKKLKEKTEGLGNENKNKKKQKKNATPDTGSPTKSKMSSKGKKLKNLESNKVFENVKGKNYEKRRVVPSSEEGKPKRQETFVDPSSKSKNSKKQKQRRKDEPRYYDRDIKDQKLQQTRSEEPERLSPQKAQIKYDDFSSKETQYRQQKQEFNTNYDTRNSGKASGKSNNGNKKGKNWQSKEKSDRGRDRATSWGN